MPDFSIAHPEHRDVIPLPEPSVPIRVRKAVMSDLKFVDDLQKSCPGALGFQFESALIKRIEQGNILIAEVPDASPVASAPGSASACVGDSTSACGVDSLPARPIGYCLGVDRYYKRDDLGIIYQMGVLPEYRRSLVAAHLLKAKFEDSAYGCKLYCCWCAQDLTHANEFWEAMGFSALAFRTGSTKTKFIDRDGNKKTGGRIHIFWQKRIRIGDHVTPWWYPSETAGGAIGANRIALPIPPGTHWSDAKPVVLPPELLALPEAEPPESGEGTNAKTPRRKGKAEQAEKDAEGLGNEGEGSGGGLGGFSVGFGPSPELLAAEAEVKEAEIKAKKARLKAKRLAERARQKTNDPALCAFSRELRDRWQECVEAQPGLIEGAANARYEVGRLVAPGSAPGANAVSIEVPCDYEVVSQVIPERKRIEAA